MHTMHPMLSCSEGKPEVWNGPRNLPNLLMVKLPLVHLLSNVACWSFWLFSLLWHVAHSGGKPGRCRSILYVLRGQLQFPLCAPLLASAVFFTDEIFTVVAWHQADVCLVVSHRWNFDLFFFGNPLLFHQFGWCFTSKQKSSSLHSSTLKPGAFLHDYWSSHEGTKLEAASSSYRWSKSEQAAAGRKWILQLGWKLLPWLKSKTQSHKMKRNKMNSSIPSVKLVGKSAGEWGIRWTISKWLLSGVNAPIGTAAYSQHVLRSWSLKDAVVWKNHAAHCDRWRHEWIKHCKLSFSKLLCLEIHF